jgi:hypothetical protein
MAPGTVVALLNVGIQRAVGDTPEAMTVDAAAVNPQSKAETALLFLPR